MSVVHEFEAAREDLEALLVEVLTMVVGEEASVTSGETLPPGPVVSALLAVHDEVDDSFTRIEVRTGVTGARIIAARMLGEPDPGPDDVLDAVAELGNILGGNVKSLLRHSCRLSLPTAEVVEATAPNADPLPGVTVQAAVFLGQIVELWVHSTDRVTGLYWPGSHHLDVLENQS